MKLQLTFLIIFGSIAVSASAQDSPIGLPPFAEVNAPEPKKSWFQLTIEKRKAKYEQRQAGERKRFGQQDPVPAPVPFNGNPAISKDGRHLKAFGVEGYYPPQEAESGPELVELSPVPDVRTPSQKSWAEKKKEKQQEKFAARQAANAKLKETQAANRATMADANRGRERFGQQPVFESVTYNGVPAVGKDGSTLRPFGVEGYYEAPAQETESPLVEIAPIPDIRTPAQKTWAERKREERQKKFEERQAANKSLKLARVGGTAE